MRRTYYTTDANLVFNSALPDEKSLQVENGVLRGRNSDRIAAQRMEPPHVAFANLGYDPNQLRSYASNDDAVKFIKRYGPLRSGPEETFEVSLAEFTSCQLELRNAWNVRDARYFTEPQDLITYISLDSLRVNWKATPDGLELHPVSLLAYMGLLLARDLGEGSAKKCANPKCPAPYFVAQRRDAKFCSHSCASTISQQNFRKRHTGKKKIRRKR